MSAALRCGWGVKDCTGGDHRGNVHTIRPEPRQPDPGNAWSTMEDPPDVSMFRPEDATALRLTVGEGLALGVILGVALGCALSLLAVLVVTSG